MRCCPDKKELGRLKASAVSPVSTTNDTFGDVTNPSLSPVATYLYDSNGSAHIMGAGRRTKKITTADANIGAGVVHFVYDGIMTIEERDGMDAVLRQYVNGQRVDEHLAMDIYTSGTITSTHYYHENALGNVIALTDSTGAVVERYTYEAYGKPEFRDPSNSLLSTFSSPVGNPFLFNGQRYDPESGISYYRHRYLNHSQGRFVNRDPVGLVNLLNHFAYIANNPLNGLDFLGLQESVDLTGGPFGTNDKDCLEYDYSVYLKNGNIISGSNLRPKNGEIAVIINYGNVSGVLTLKKSDIAKATRRCVKQPAPPQPIEPLPPLINPPEGEDVPPVPDQPTPGEPSAPAQGTEKESPCARATRTLIQDCHLFDDRKNEMLNPTDCCICASSVNAWLEVCVTKNAPMLFKATMWVNDKCSKGNATGMQILTDIHGPGWSDLVPGKPPK